MLCVQLVEFYRDSSGSASACSAGLSVVKVGLVGSLLLNHVQSDLDEVRLVRLAVEFNTASNRSGCPRAFCDRAETKSDSDPSGLLGVERFLCQSTRVPAEALRHPPVYDFTNQFLESCTHMLWHFHDESE
jgi:hypothetical protein